MVRTLIGGLLGGLAMFITGFIFWGTPLSALALSRVGDQASANLQAAMAQALSPTGTGVYVIPDPATAQGTILYGRGPVAQVFYNEGGFPVMDSGALIGGLILSLVVGVIIALALRFALSDFASRARVTILFALAAVLWLHIGQAVFNHAPWGYIIYLAFSDFVALAVAGLIAAKLMNSKADTGMATADAGTLH
ncbi:MULTISPECIES: hypothetical protein [Sphingobium]|jgi:hypothetical protein|uniref:hypothetical protein n=1 Tax=Sphingobium TaxID=165695 RepID=UPI000DBBA6E1|nr:MULTISPECIES: hypothetical protein [Sphingobium]KAA9019312.1 hypothetical protein F4U94_04050 [Sphingobium limneticum]MBU0933046.1 hypothetical protein [Alphaproteobacteria bacterium]BBD01801.1 hypothetical protein YGS_C1P3056 [Sphingobium sp. YG1]